MSMTEQKRLTGPDFVKGLAIVLMVYGHLDHAGSLVVQQKAAVKWVYSFHMPLFLLISGFLFKLRSEGKILIGNVVSKILRPYLIFAALYLCGLWVASTMGLPTANVAPQSAQGFFDTLFLHPRGGYWFLHSLLIIQISLIIPKTIRIFKNNDPLIYFILSSLIWVICIYYNVILPRTIAFFMIGFCLGNIWGMFRGGIWVGFAGAMITAGLSCSDLFTFSMAQIVWAVSLLCFLSGVSEAKPSALAVRFFAWLGKNSMGILVFHAIYVSLFKILSKSILKVEPSGILNSIAATVFCVGACLATSFLIDRAKMTMFLFGSNNVYFPFRAKREFIVGC
ncbi:MAG: hypothetical protein JWM59_2387 [Verrucomicrobiales bacterium]|nr:hypothetical protein [Verrucomicrobiales bacterium]